MSDDLKDALRERDEARAIVNRLAARMRIDPADQRQIDTWPTAIRRVKGLVAVRANLGNKWHWATSLEPSSARTECGGVWSWNRSVRPFPADPIDLEAGDQLCGECSSVRSWDDYVIPSIPKK